MSQVYFTDASTRGRVRWRQLRSPIGVLESLDKPMTIGIATEIGSNHRGAAVWSLYVHRAIVPGRWVIVDGRFVPVEDAAGGRSPAPT
jgi:hypothetical protein